MNKIEILLQDMTYNTQYEFLEYAANKDELDNIAKKRGIRLPSKDLAIFKSRYAFVNRQNKNGCTLPKEEVEKALDTLVGKAVDFDHLRKRVVGHWIDATLKGDEILAYGAFFKSNFDEDYEVIKELMKKGNLAISFEAWGNREMKDEGYNLTDIEFAGGALLLKEEPAFPGSQMLDMARTKVLEFAKVMIPPRNFIHTGEIKMIDFENFTGAEEELENQIIDFEGETEESKKLTYKERKDISDDMFAVVVTVKNKITGEPRKIIMFPIHDPAHVRNALARLPQATETLNKLGVSPESVKKKILKRARELNMTSLLERYKGEMEEIVMEEKIKALETEIASLKATLEEKDKVIVSKDEEITKSNQVIETLKKESEAAKVKIEEIQKDVEKKIQEAKAEAIKLTQRRNELGDFVKDIKDEDLLDDAKYENLKLKKTLKEKDEEIAALKKKKKKKDEEGDGDDNDDSDDENDNNDEGNEKGSKDKNITDKTKQRKEKIRNIAFGQ